MVERNSIVRSRLLLYSSRALGGRFDPRIDTTGEKPSDTRFQVGRSDSINRLASERKNTRPPVTVAEGGRRPGCCKLHHRSGEILATSWGMGNL